VGACLCVGKHTFSPKPKQNPGTETISQNKIEPNQNKRTDRAEMQFGMSKIVGCQSGQTGRNRRNFGLLAAFDSVFSRGSSNGNYGAPAASKRGND